MNKEKRFPTILGLIFLIIALFVGIYLTTNRTSLGSKASGDCIPINSQVTNITNSTADISFLTSASCLVSLSVNGQLLSDIKNDTATKIHYFQVRNLKNNTSYNYTIISGGQNYTENSFVFETGSNPVSSLPTSNLAWGKVFDAESKPAVNALVYLNIPGASPLSSFITTDGNWSVSLASTFNDSKTDWFIPPENATDEDIVVISDDGTTTQVTNSTALNNPVPDIVIGRDSLAAPQVTSLPVGKVVDTTNVQSEKSVDIFNPQDNETLNVVRPDFFGTAPASSKVIIEVNSETVINGESLADNSGSWHWSPPSDLAPGKHTITVKVQNTTTGIWETVTRNFTVLAGDDDGPSYQASSSATIIPTAVPSVIPTTAVIPTTVVLTPTDTLKPSITPITETVTPSSTSSTLYQTGGSFPTYFLVLLSIILFGFSLYYLRR